MGLPRLGFSSFAIVSILAGTSAFAAPELWYMTSTELAYIELSADGSTATITASPLVPAPPGGHASLTLLQDGSLLGSTLPGGGAPFTTTLLHIPSPPTDGSPAAVTILGTMPDQIGVESLYTDCDGRVYVMDTGSNDSTNSGNRLLRFTGDYLAGDFSFEVVSDLSASVPDIDDLGPGINGAGNVVDNPGLAIDTKTVYAIDYTDGTNVLIGVSDGRFGIHALDGSEFSDGISRAYVVDLDGALFEIDAGTASSVLFLGNGPGTGAFPDTAAGLTGRIPTCDSGFDPPAVPISSVAALVGMAILFAAGLSILNWIRQRQGGSLAA